MDEARQQPLKVTVWNECRHEKEDELVREVYPETIGGCLVDGLQPYGFDLSLTTLDDDQQGLAPELIDATDVLVWWGHRYHGEVSEDRVDHIHQRVLAGMGLVALHSSHHAQIFKRLMGTNCNLTWREADSGERERLWVIQPSHPIAQGIPPFIEMPLSEMYGEPFDIPEPDELVFASWYQGGEILRSGCCFKRGRGRIFYFGPGHETFPIYRDADIMRVIANAIVYVNRTHDDGWGLDNWGRPEPLETGAPAQTHFKKPRQRKPGK